MNEPKPLASLTPGLLARKGAARPAMRPQLQPMRSFHEATARQLEDDLGWNDMGHDLDPAEPALAEANAGAGAELPAPAEVVAITPEVELAPPAEPAVVRQQKALSESFPEIVTDVTPEVVDAPLAKPAAVRAAAPKKRDAARRSALADGRRAAFTLRLDADRHLKLRLACTISNRSAQQMVTEALDRLISDLPDVSALAAHLGKKR